MNKYILSLFALQIISLNFNFQLAGQLVINEGSNMNYSTIADEDKEYPDWIEIYNSGTDTFNLLNYALSDDNNDPVKWKFPNIKMAPGEYLVVYCSDKNRKPVSGFINVLHTGTFNAVTGWNVHNFSTPFYWDGVSNVLISTCSYSSTGYTTNSAFSQTSTSYESSVFSYIDGSEAACFSAYGTTANMRPVMRFNGITVGTADAQNSPYDYPAPYGNWYWGAKNQMLVPASELSAAGLTAGNINSLAFNVISTDPNTYYDYIDISMKLVTENSLSSVFTPVDFNNKLHTNFKISKDGEFVYLFSPSLFQVSSLFVKCEDLDVSNGCFPDANPGSVLFCPATPGATNNNSATYTDYLLEPSFSVTSGIYSSIFNVSVSNPNDSTTSVYYTLNGDDPDTSSTLYDGNPINIFYSAVLKARVFGAGILPSKIAVSSYLIGADHSTPVLSVITDNRNLYGSEGIFDNWQFDWEKASYVEYFDNNKQLVFSQNSGIQIDGGAGGSRYHPQHSFRLELDDGVLGEDKVNYPIIPNRPDRTKYNKIYLRNGSNQYLTFPHKEACQAELMAATTHNYYSAWRPISVYINGFYFGLYECREKFDADYFKSLDGASSNSVDVLSQSYWYGGVLHTTEGCSVDSFYSASASFNALNQNDTNFWSLADHYFDMEYYCDYIIGESWMGNADWPWNNIKIYRSDASGYRWRFCLIDMELAMEPNSWTDCYYDHIDYMINYDPSNPYVNIWQKGIQNDRFRYYFINRYADVMNTEYKFDRISDIESDFFTQTVVEMPDEYARWGNPGNIPQQMTEFYDNHITFSSQLELRNDVIRNQILTNFSLPNLVDLTLDVDPIGAGEIHISTIQPDDYPWQGIYFNGVPVKIVAVPNPGYNFNKWGHNLLITDLNDSVFYGILDLTTVNFKAYFDENLNNVSENKNLLFSLYPNPVEDDLVLVKETNSLNVETKYQIFDITGNLIITGELKATEQKTFIDVKKLPPSVYIMKLFNSEGQTEQLSFVKN